MRRGGRGSNLRGLWKPLDDPAIASAGYLNRGWIVRNCVCVMVLAACSMAISILIWSSRYRSSVHQLSNSGMVFPLYRYSRSDGYGMGRRENRTRRGRRIQGANDVLMNMHGGRRINFDDIDQLFIEMKLGVPPVKYNFVVDTGSHLSWVYCNTLVSKLIHWGPNGLYVPEDTSFVSCAGDTQALCQQLQMENDGLNGGVEPCVSSDNYGCRFATLYTDESISLGYVVNASFTVTMEDKSERSLFGSFGWYSLAQASVLIMHHNADGEVVCSGRGYPRTSVRRVDDGNTNEWVEILYVAAKRDSSSADGWRHWSRKMQRDSPRPMDYEICSSTVNLLSVSGLFGGSDLAFHSAVPVLLDTGSDCSIFATNVYEPILEALDLHATYLGFSRVVDGRFYVAEQQRECWLAKGSPIREFPPIIFEFEGIDSASQQDASQYLVVEPADYLVWDATTKKLCAIILHNDDFSTSIIGVDMMREHLYVYDFENQRVRWTYDKCKLN